MSKTGQVKISKISNYPGLFERLGQAVGTTQTGKIADFFGVSPSLVSDWKAERARPGIDELLKAAKFGNTTIEWLLTGDEFENFESIDQRGKTLGYGEKPSEAQLKKFLNIYDPEIRKLMRQKNWTYDKAVHELVLEGLVALGLATRRIEHPIKFLEVNYEIVLVPVVGTIAAGRPIEAVEDIRWEKMPRFWKETDDVVALVVKGESMLDAGIHDGDLVLVSRSRQAKKGDKVAAMIDGEATVKFYFPENGKIRLEPANAEFSPIVVDAEQFQIYGVVIGVLQV